MWNKSSALVLLFVALWFILRGDLLYVFPCVILFLCFDHNLCYSLNMTHKSRKGPVCNIRNENVKINLRTRKSDQGLRCLVESRIL